MVCSLSRAVFFESLLLTVHSRHMKRFDVLAREHMMLCLGFLFYRMATDNMFIYRTNRYIYRIGNLYSSYM